MYTPTIDTMRELRSQGNLCPLFREILADLETPVSAFLKITRSGPAFLLESVENGNQVNRYSFLGADPYMTLRMDQGGALATQGGYKQTQTYTDPLAVLASYVDAYLPVRLPDLPRFVGGAVGYLGYEAAGNFERLPRPGPGAYSMPEGWWMFVDTLLVFDHVKHKIKVVSHVHLDAEDLEAEYARAVGKIDDVIARLRQPLPAPAVQQQVGTLADTPPAVFESNVTREQYFASVAKAQELVFAGDIFQVQISQRFSRKTSADSFTIYRALRTINPSPYMFYIRTGEGDLVGASPEMLVRVEDGAVETHPIAGTRWRGRSAAEDEELAAGLLADEKECAEHLMLVDLGRNDIGRISVPGSVAVPRLMTIEMFSHVMHIVSVVTGQLRPDMTPLDALRANFPAGTVTGAPKIRAMEVIAELEGEQRGIYAGAVGHVGFNGDLDTCIALRTMVVKDGVAYAQAAAGVVADSTPEYEYNESKNKAAALLRAVELAETL